LNNGTAGAIFLTPGSEWICARQDSGNIRMRCNLTWWPPHLFKGRHAGLGGTGMPAERPTAQDEHGDR